jgi:hypothetical protein
MSGSELGSRSDSRTSFFLGPGWTRTLGLRCRHRGSQRHRSTFCRSRRSGPRGRREALAARASAASAAASAALAGCTRTSRCPGRCSLGPEGSGTLAMRRRRSIARSHRHWRSSRGCHRTRCTSRRSTRSPCCRTCPAYLCLCFSCSTPCRMAAAWAAAKAGRCRSLSTACTRYPRAGRCTCRGWGRRGKRTPSPARRTILDLGSTGHPATCSGRSRSTFGRPGSRMACPSGTRCHTSSRHLRSSSRSSSGCTAHRREARHSWRRAAPRPRAPAARPWSARGGGPASRQKAISPQDLRWLWHQKSPPRTVKLKRGK